MTDFYYRADQAEADELFGKLSAEEAAELILGIRKLTPDQFNFLERCSEGLPYQLVFQPQPAGHVGFSTYGSKGCGNKGFVVIRPATAECGRMVKEARRKAFVADAARVGMTREAAEKVFKLVRGYVPALNAALDIWPTYIAGARSDDALRDAGFRPRHPVEGAAIDAVREAAL